MNIRPVIGRPLRDDAGEWILAPFVAGTDWEHGDARKLEEHEDWAASAAGEHASVGEFARLVSMLLALGAPPDLVSEAHIAALDEVRHARTCFAFAGVGPGKLAVDRSSSEVSLAALVRETVRDGCYGETAGSIELRRKASGDVRIEAMAEDEERHALLAWRILRWAAQEAPRVTATAITEVAAALPDDVVAEAVVRPCLGALLTELGRTLRGGSCAPSA